MGPPRRPTRADVESPRRGRTAQLRRTCQITAMAVHQVWPQAPYAPYALWALALTLGLLSLLGAAAGVVIWHVLRS